MLLLGAGVGLGVAALTNDDEVKKDQVVTAQPTTPPPAAAPTPVPTAPTVPTTPVTPPTTTPTTPIPGATTPTTPSTPPPAGGGAVAEWPAGETAFTIVLASTDTRGRAEAKARDAVERGIPAGVLRSDDYSSLKPGFWVVFAGQYATSAKAEADIEKYAGMGFGGGYPRQVKK